MDLHNIFAGIGLRRFHQDKEDLIDRIAGGRIDDLPVMEMMGNKMGMASFGLKYFFSDRLG